MTDEIRICQFTVLGTKSLSKALLAIRQYEDGYLDQIDREIIVINHLVGEICDGDGCQEEAQRGTSVEEQGG